MLSNIKNMHCIDVWAPVRHDLYMAITYSNKFAEKYNIYGQLQTDSGQFGG